MNILKLSLSVSAISFLLIACGDGNGSSKSSASYTEVKTIGQAENNLYALGFVLNEDYTMATYSRRSSGSMHKALTHALEEKTIQCDIGTVETIETDGSLTHIYKECTLDDTYTDGTHKITVENNGDIIEEFSNYTIKKNGVEYFSNLIHTIKRRDEAGVDTLFNTLNGVNKKTHLDGTIDIATYDNYTVTTTYEEVAYNGKLKLDLKCLKGIYTVNTIHNLEKYGRQGYVGYYEYGSIDINGGTYTYDEDGYVTIEAGGESKTYFQGKIKERMDGYRNDDCSI